MGQEKYTVEHEWLRVGDDGLVTVGITAYAQDHLGDLVFVQLPEVGAAIAKGAEAAVIESVKAASEINMPVAGTVVAINETLADAPEKVNEDPLGEGWFFKMKIDDAAELNGLMDKAAYDDMIKGLA